MEIGAYRIAGLLISPHPQVSVLPHARKQPCPEND